jgi:hypothetical protein
MADVEAFMSDVRSNCTPVEIHPLAVKVDPSTQVSITSLES